MTFDEILRAYAMGMIHRDRLRALMVEMPAFRMWLRNESRRMRVKVEAGAVPGTSHRCYVAG